MNKFVYIYIVFITNNFAVFDWTLELGYTLSILGPPSPHPNKSLILMGTTVPPQLLLLCPTQLMYE